MLISKLITKTKILVTWNRLLHLKNEYRFSNINQNSSIKDQSKQIGKQTKDKKQQGNTKKPGDEENSQNSQQKKSKSRFSVNQISLFMFSGLGALASIEALYQFYLKEFIERKRKYNILEKQARTLQNISQSSHFIPGLQLQKKIRQVLFEKSFQQRSNFTVVTGLPRQGKSTALIHLLKNLTKQQKQQATYYYISLRNQLRNNEKKKYKEDEQENKSQLDVLEFKINQIYKLLHAINLQKAKNPVLIIDQFSECDNLSQNELNSTIYLLYTQKNYPQAKFIAISNSSKFTMRLNDNKMMSKYPRHFVNIDCHEQKMLQSKAEIIKKLMEYHGRKLGEKENSMILEFVQRVVSLRKFHEQFINQRQFENLDIAQTLKAIEENQYFDAKMSIKQSFDQIAKQQPTEVIKTIEQIMTEYNGQMKKKCKNILLQNGIKFRQSLDILHDKNSIYFCTPRNKIIQKAFRDYIQDIKRKKKKE